MKTLVVEDSRLAREGLISMLARYEQLEIVGSAKDADEALQAINDTQPELIFLDIHLPGDSGFDLLDKLTYQPKIIFTTAYSEYAIQSFDHNTIDYLLKPISQERLDKAIQKLDQLPNNTNHNPEANKANVESDYSESPIHRLDITSKIFTRDGDQCHLINVDTIEYIESCKNYSQVYFHQTNTKQTLTKAFIKKPLNHIDQRLPEDYFFRANRQFIINLNLITGITESISDGFEVTMKSGTIIEVSRRNATNLKNRLSV